jgi:hypothetical protein
LTKKIKKGMTANTQLPQTRRQKPTHKGSTGGGYSAVEPLAAIKKKTTKKVQKSQYQFDYAISANLQHSIPQFLNKTSGTCLNPLIRHKFES